MASYRWLPKGADGCLMIGCKGYKVYQVWQPIAG